ncbi:MAG: hypothetical protein WC455_28490 [Dehalococcoidia bacterium]
MTITILDNRYTGLTDSETAEVRRWATIVGVDDLIIVGHTIHADGDTWSMDEVQRDLDDYDAALEAAGIRRQYDE